jgi:hypothetical protein
LQKSVDFLQIFGEISYLPYSQTLLAMHPWRQGDGGGGGVYYGPSSKLAKFFLFGAGL